MPGAVGMGLVGSMHLGWLPQSRAAAKQQSSPSMSASTSSGIQRPVCRRGLGDFSVNPLCAPSVLCPAPSSCVMVYMDCAPQQGVRCGDQLWGWVGAASPKPSAHACHRCRETLPFPPPRHYKETGSVGINHLLAVVHHRGRHRYAHRHAVEHARMRQGNRLPLQPRHRNAIHALRRQWCNGATLTIRPQLRQQAPALNTHTPPLSSSGVLAQREGRPLHMMPAPQHHGPPMRTCHPRPLKPQGAAPLSRSPGQRWLQEPPPRAWAGC